MVVVWFPDKRCPTIDRRVAQASPVMSYCTPTYHALPTNPRGFRRKPSVFVGTKHGKHCLLHPSINMSQVLIRLLCSQDTIKCVFEVR